MNRRDFLRGAAGAALAFGLAALQPGKRASSQSPQAGAPGTQASAVTPRFRGSSDGRIYELSQDGVTWQPRANFGKHCAITEVVERGGKVVARIEVQGHPFIVQSPDGRRWHALDWVPVRA
jgi:hypothetical protein